MPLFKKRRKSSNTSSSGLPEEGANGVFIEYQSSKCKKFIRLSPGSKKKHSRQRENSAGDEPAVSPGHSRGDTPGGGMAKSKGDQRVPNGLTDQETRYLKQAFDMFDKNHDGKISSDELSCVLRTLGHEHPQKEVDDMIKNADTNENGFVEYDEFLTMMQRASSNDFSDVSTVGDEKRKREAFKVFDLDGNGFIDKHELKCVMRRLGENLSEDDIEAMIKEADLNEDGMIDYFEFSKLNMA